MLNLKIPPVVVLLFLLSFMYLANQNLINQANDVTRGAGAVILLLSVVVAASAVMTFRRHKTTVNPHKIENASALVTSGVFKFSRNPMYLAMALVLFGISVCFGVLVVGVVTTAVFILYITQFQIKPEERMLQRKFGSEYKDYCNTVRRWI
ncbi:methyltransferase family protein [Marinomonas mediterranea]|jgi:Putative protein-S-isoprenylcysteine methyltransferase|uniref:Isoprenylcysteine carboxyl methyltransferase n=1 Tax=Marinomonas mediterranea (strain ATCC 700492 / JCM 21426 / NBRC 103028 / MMB-1) TaxID=717774 RepID=F2K0K3_MARM1|nr:isoprenylcysteine carboxylmethyltransferase family protein [Marinomonas mediterranea]ADZ90987.1 Isoprenylcysteine carboxyl methyltransferase [Marinomonas mediterranea MMB-1]WCN09026.1 DUF1295 domain-containing protein [Marinomonas mediterranea]WCN13060.1 DUF1295 domain-containing protein [Marinomonas mediterranea]WCN17129.1 DUF1295 domain-containing protein [Marinomonas mediterranea MMB-1]